MILKTLQVTLLSFLLFIVPGFIFENYTELREHNFSYGLSSFVQVLFYGIPVLAIGFLAFMAVNWILISLLRDKTKPRKNRTYFLLGSIITVLPILGLIIFDYLQRDRYFAPYNSIGSIFVRYSLLLLWVAIALLINRKIVWKNFV
jgi:ABC-type dipeptide/oligopeptide/nickel transport system permease component